MLHRELSLLKITQNGRWFRPMNAFFLTLHVPSEDTEIKDLCPLHHGQLSCRNPTSRIIPVCIYRWKHNKNYHMFITSIKSFLCVYPIGFHMRNIIGASFYLHGILLDKIQKKSYSVNQARLLPFHYSLRYEKYSLHKLVQHA